MEFCPKCKSMMMPAKKVYKCRKCGFEKEIKESIVSKTERKEREVTVLEQRRWDCPLQERSARTAATIQPIGGCASFALLMRAKSGSSGAQSAGRHGESIIDALSIGI